MFRNLAFWTVFFTVFLLSCVGITMSAFSQSQNVGGLALRTGVPSTTPTTLVASRTITPTASFAPTYVMPTIAGMKSDQRCVGVVPPNSTMYFWSAGQFMTAGSPQNPVVFVGGEKLSGYAVNDYCEVIVGASRSFHKLVGTPTPAPSSTPTPTATQTTSVAKPAPQNVPAAVVSCSSLVTLKFVVPQGTPIRYRDAGGGFHQSAFGFRGGETPNGNQSGEYCETGASSTAVGVWWFKLTDVQLPSVPPPTSLPQAPAFGQTSSPVSVAPSLLNVVVEDEQKSQLSVRPAFIAEALASQGYKNPANIKFVWKTQDELMVLLQPRVAPVPADVPNGTLSEKGVAKIYLNSTPATTTGIEAEIAKALAQLVLEQKSNHQVDPTEGGKDAALARQAVAAYKFIDQDIKTAQIGKLSVTVTGSGPYSVNAREVSRFITDQGLSYPTFRIIWQTGDQLAALGSRAAPSLGPQAVAPAIFNAIFVPADLDGFDSLNVQGLSEKGTVKVFLSNKIEGSDPNRTLAHEVARLIARYVKGMTDNNGGRGDAAITSIEQELSRTYTGAKAFVLPKSQVTPVASTTPTATIRAQVSPTQSITPKLSFTVEVDGAGYPVNVQRVAQLLSEQGLPATAPRKWVFYVRDNAFLSQFDPDAQNSCAVKMTYDCHLIGGIFIADDVNELGSIYLDKSPLRKKFSVKGQVSIYLNSFVYTSGIFAQARDEVDKNIAHEISHGVSYYRDRDPQSGGEGPGSTTENRAQEWVKYHLSVLDSAGLIPTTIAAATPTPQPSQVSAASPVGAVASRLATPCGDSDSQSLVLIPMLDSGKVVWNTPTPSPLST